jgi:hypothetical protein
VTVVQHRLACGSIGRVFLFQGGRCIRSKLMNPRWCLPAPTNGNATWTLLSGYVRSDQVLLHGSRTTGLARLNPQAPLDNSRDDFSKATTVFAAEDPTWAIGYAVKDRTCRQFLNACFYPARPADGFGNRQISLSYAAWPDGALPVSTGVVYVLPRAPFARMPEYTDPELGPIMECQWICETQVPVIAEVAVTPEDLPRWVVTTHDSGEPATSVRPFT